MVKKEIKKLEKILKIRFRNKNIIALALTHKSYGKERSLKHNNERLEFLGDSVLALIVSNYLYFLYPYVDEGFLSKLRSKIVSRKNCASWGEKLNLGEYLFLGKGEELSNGRHRFSNIANTFESVLGAIYLDRGYKKAEKFLIKLLKEMSLDDLEEDYKSKLQELVQDKHKLIPKYNVVKEKGPEHQKIFTVEVVVGKKIIGTGKGKSKKKAEQLAAENALKQKFNF